MEKIEVGKVRSWKNSKEGKTERKKGLKGRKDWKDGLEGRTRRKGWQQLAT